MQTEPMTSYSERRVAEEKRFVLYEDRVLFFWHQAFGTRAESSFELASLNPNPSRFWVRDRRVESIAAWSIILGWVALVPAPYLFLASGTFFDHWVKFVVVAITGTLLVVILLIFNPRRLEYAEFPNHAGILQLIIGQVGRDKADFEGFVELLVEKISAAQEPRA